MRGPTAWRTFAAEVLGAQVTDGNGPDADTIYRGIDDCAYRIVVYPDDDQLEFTGWEVATPGLNALLRDLNVVGVPCKDDADLAAQRGVAQLVTCSDPAGRDRSSTEAAPW